MKIHYRAAMTQPPWGPPSGPAFEGPDLRPAGPPPVKGTNGFAVAGLVLGILGGALLSTVFSLVALSQIKKNGGQGRGMAIAGLVLSGLWVVGVVTVVAIGLSSTADRGGSGEVVGAGSVSVKDLRVGDCVEEWAEKASVLTVRLTPCAQPHDAQVVAEDDLVTRDEAYPGDDEVSRMAEDLCSGKVDALDDSRLPETGSIAYFRPLEASWQDGDRKVSCLVVADVPMTSSLLGP